MKRKKTYGIRGTIYDNERHDSKNSLLLFIILNIIPYTGVYPKLTK